VISGGSSTTGCGGTRGAEQVTASSIALLVAIDRYDDPRLRQLHAPSHDLAALSRVLEDPEIGGYRVQALHNEPAHLVQEHIGDLFADKVPDDRLLLYFSGHGLKTDYGELYLATTNTKLRKVTATAVPSSFIRGEMTRSRSRRIILLLDCCYGGAFNRGDLIARADDRVDVLERFEGRGRAVITASTAMQYAFEADRDRRVGTGSPSVFTGALVRGLETGDADRDSDGRISVDELYDYLCEQVRRQIPDQMPTRSIDVEGELFVARSRWRRPSLPDPLPAALQQPTGNPRPGVLEDLEAVVRDLEDLLSSTNTERAGKARQALERLRGDDSKRVSSAAAAALARHHSRAASAEAPVAVQPRPAPTRPPPARSDPPITRSGRRRYEQPPSFDGHMDMEGWSGVAAVWRDARPYLRVVATELGVYPVRYGSWFGRAWAAVRHAVNILTKPWRVHDPTTRRVLRSLSALPAITGDPRWGEVLDRLRRYYEEGEASGSPYVYGTHYSISVVQPPSRDEVRAYATGLHQVLCDIQSLRHRAPPAVRMPRDTTAMTQRRLMSDGR
jgi:Caspase domain